MANWKTHSLVIWTCKFGCVAHANVDGQASVGSNVCSANLLACVSRCLLQELQRSYLRGRPAHCAKCRHPHLWRRLSCRERPTVASICGFDLATEVGVTFFYADTGKQNDGAPMLTRGYFWPPWGAVAVEQLEVLVCGLLSRVMGVVCRSHTAFPPADVSLKLEAALPVNSQSAPPSARVLQVGGLPWGFVEPVGDMLGRATLVTEDGVFRRDMGVHSRGGVSQVCISHYANNKIVSSGIFLAVN